MQPPDSTTGDSANPIPPRRTEKTNPLDPKEGFSETVQPDGSDAGDEFTAAIHQSAQDEEDRELVLEDIMARILKGEVACLVFAKPEKIPGRISAFKLCVKDGHLAIDDY